jgi:energy-coupling factor transporter ATP-binding protein EcfA2
VPSEFTQPGNSVGVMLVRDFMAREELAARFRNIRTPILLFTGVRGSGKTTLLTGLEGLLAKEKLSYSRVDGEWPLDSSRYVLSLIAFDLSRRSGGGDTGRWFGQGDDKLSFPRLMTGEIVLAADVALDLTDPRGAPQRVKAVLAAHERTQAVLEDTVTTILHGAVESLQALGPATGIVKAVADLAGKYGTRYLLGKLAETRRGRAVLLGKGLEWWGDQDRDLRRDAVEELIDLRLAADRARARQQARGRRQRGDENDDDEEDDAWQRADDTDARRVTQLLWEAFLADLRENYADPMRAGEWPRNCVLLLDNADTPVARTFLQELVNAREERGGGEADPLTVVATSRGGLVRPMRLAGLTPLAAASVTDYRDRGATGTAVWWYPVQLSPLTWTQTRDMVGALRLPGVDVEALSTAVHAFTAGLPQATGLLLAAMNDELEAARDLDLSALLGAAAPGRLSSNRTVEQVLLDRMLARLGTRDEAPAGDLATCAAARHREAALRLATDCELMEALPREETAIFAAEFWQPDPSGGPSVLHPMLRSLLLRRLAERGPGARASWARVHLWLRDRAAQEGQQDVALYHTLALASTPSGELTELLRQAGAEEGSTPLAHAEPLEYVARQLAESLGSSRARTWLRRVARVTAAPRRLGAVRTPRPVINELTAWAGLRELPIAPVARYVACSWLGADPLSAPHWRWLLNMMAGELGQIAPYGDDEGLSVLRGEAERYRDCAGGGWQEVLDFWVPRARPARDSGHGDRQ